MAKILVVAEVKGTEIKKPTLELLSHAKSLNIDTEAVLIGDGVSEQAGILAGYGARKVYLADDSSLGLYNTASSTALVLDAVKQSEASQVWLSASELGRDLTPRVAARLGVGALTDLTKLEVDGDEITAYRPSMSTKVIQKCGFAKEGIRVLCIRAGAFDAADAEPATADVVNLSLPEQDIRALVKEIVTESTGEVDLQEAEIVVSVGRGVKGPEGVDFVRPLAQVLGAAYGSSRAVCDAGWAPHTAQVGQTGKVVAPDVYFAIGISGAIQHLAGMSGSKLIIAINKDPDAPIFKVADYGIVGDLFKVVPILIEEFKKIKEA
ncbi:MAG: electron transfer flavoprotein subunit alpha/FixB family protein [SAR324 cluster bacterium]|nr:electron transfer flavoprotein subunit alpha/FixB family protein [SAR324 cluster bacterium]